MLDAVSATDVARLDEIARRGKSEHALAAGMLSGLIALDSRPEWGRQMLEWIWLQGHDPGESRLVRTYFSSMRLPVQITPEIEVDEALGRNLIGLMIAEWKQADGDIAGAVDVVEQLDPTPAAALSLAELYFDSDRYGDVVEITDGLTNSDDVTALLLVYRGVALRELGHNESARLAFKEALRARSRSAEVRFRALVERALTYHADGKLALARKDLDRIRAEDASYPGLSEALIALGLEHVEDAGWSDEGLESAREAQPPPPDWYVDPFGRHTHRYWDGAKWTGNVADNGVPAVDPPSLPPPIG